MRRGLRALGGAALIGAAATLPVASRAPLAQSGEPRPPQIAIRATSAVELTLQPSSEAFPNPERGFVSWTEITTRDHSYVRQQGNTLTRPYYRLDAFRDQPLTAAFLAQLNTAFARARQAGIKVIPRFSYNFGPYPNSEPDASRERIHEHIAQLTSVLASNEDVIASLEAGFIGAWGEWHTSTHKLDRDLDAKADVLQTLFAALPRSRMVALRYPSDMRLLNGPPISEADAFLGTNHARVGSHQDCFLASDDDSGTWGRDGGTIEDDKDYVAQNGRFSVVGGETCSPNPPRSSCPTAVAEMERLHWSYLNLEYEPRVIQGFKDGGCFDEISRRLGYRLRITTGHYSSVVRRGETLSLHLEIANDGFAAMFNERPAYTVLFGGGRTHVCRVNADPRRWAAGARTAVDASCPVPDTLAPGAYSLAFWLPDAALSLRSDPRYAVRLANLGTWDEATGYNVITDNGVSVVP